MRISKKLLVFLFVASIFTSCKDDDNTSFALQDISAPSNLSAVFDISQDDTGTVTITPTAVGASSFDVFFGDVEGETATVVSPGETIRKVYGEGEFNLRIVAVGTTGLTSELVRVVTISFTAPTELTATVAISDTNPFEVNVTPSATNATVYDVFFGLGPDEVPVTIMNGETASYMYAEAGDYEVRIIARGAGSATIEISETITITGNAEPIVLPITFDDATVNYAFSTFNGASYEVVDNPDVSGANAEESKVGAITNSGAQFEGGAFTLGTPIDFSGANKTVSMKFWATSALPVLLKFEGGVNDERQTEVVAQHGGTGWEILTFDFATDAIKSFIDGNQGVGEAFVPDGQYTTMVIFVDGPGTTAGTFYLDDIAQTSGETSPLAMPISFDDSAVNYDFGVFNGATYEVVDNPDASGANTTVSKVGAITNSGAQFEGGAFSLDTPVDFSTDKTITMKFWATASLPILLKFEGGVNGERENEVVATHGGTGWEELTFDFSTNATKSFIDGNQGVGEAFVPEGQYATLVLFVDGPGTTSGTFYMDDIAQSASGGTGGVATSLPISFENGETLSGVFEAGDGVTGMPISNPDASGINTSATVFEFNKVNGAAWYSGIFQIFPSNIDFATNQVVSFKIWSPKAGINVRVQLEKEGGGGGATIFVDNTLASSNEWFTINADFSGIINGSDAYDKIVIFPDFDDVAQAAADGSIYYIDDIEQTMTSGGGTGGKTTFPVDFESGTAGAGSQWNIFENADNPALGIISNPDVTGANTSATVAEFTARLGGQPFAGAETPLETPFTLNTSNSTVKIMVWKSVISDVGIKFANAAGGSTGEIKVPNTLTNQWEELTFDFSGVIGDPNNTNIEFLVVFPDFDARTQDNVVYFDNVTLSASGSGGTGGSAPTTAAATPTQMEADVISMFSNAYAPDVTVSSWRSDWSTGILTDIQVDGNDTKQYEAADFVGVEFYGTPVDASSMGFFHVDVWSPVQTTFSIKLVDLGAGSVEGNVERTIATGQWVSLDIPMADFIAAGLSTQTSIQQLLFDGTAGVADSFDFYIDNVYFHN